jgi:Ni/Co efflux regulator RcnB
MGDFDGSAVYQFISNKFGGEFMKKIILTAVAILALAASMAWAEPNGEHSPQPREEQSVTGTTTQSTEQAAPKGRSRGASISDFVTPGRAVEKDCEGTNCREQGKPQPEMRAPEKKCSSEQSC